MRKEVIFLIFLFIIPLVNAQQEITIFGTSYSIILVAPLFFMALVALFFFGLIIKDNLPKIMHFKLKTSGIMLKHKKHEVKIEPEKEINFHSKLHSLKIKLYKLGEEPSFDEFNALFKEFIKTRFNIKQEFTFPEIANLIKDVKIISLADKISKLKYGGVKIDYNDINELLNSFTDILAHYRIKHELIKLSTFEKLRLNIAKLFKKEIEVKPVKIKAKLELPKAPTKVLFKPVLEEKKPLSFLLRKINYKLFASIRKRHILNLIKHGRNILIKNPNLAKRLYARALLNYYKLPLKFEKDIANELIGFNDELLKYRVHEKAFLDVSSSLLRLKHQGKHVSEKGIGLVNIMKNFIKKEELLSAVKLKEFSKKLGHAERALKYYAPKKVEVKPEIKHIEFEKPEVKFEHFDKERFKFLLRHPGLHKEKHEIIKPVKRLTKNLRLLQKEKSHIYNKLVNLENIHSHHKLEHKFHKLKAE